MGRHRAASPATVEVDGLTVVRGGRAVLTDLDVTFEPGVTGLLGPSGSGKTTLLRTLVGVQRVRAGEVRVLGLPAGSAVLKREVGYVTQTTSVYGDLTVAENLAFAARVLQCDAGRVAEVLDEVELTPEGGRLVRELSGGQRARASLAVALLGRPAVLVLDEPTVGLDPLLRRSLWTIFHRLGDAGCTLVVSSHVMDEARRCDRLVLMREGAVLATGTPAELEQRTGAADVEAAFIALVGER